MAQVPLRIIRTQLTEAHRVVPVRFARAVTDGPQLKEKLPGVGELYSPDLDDHGLLVAGGTCTARGPVLGLTSKVVDINKAAPFIRIRVIRDLIASDAPLFPTVDDPTVAQILFPKPGIAVATADRPAIPGEPPRKADCIDLQAVANPAAPQMTLLKLHFGAPAGPVVAEMTLRVYKPITVRVKPHLVNINPVAGSVNNGPITWNLARVDRLFENIDAVWVQAGIRFVVVADTDAAGARVIRQDNITHFFKKDTVEIENNNAREFFRILKLNPERDMLNIYFVQAFSERHRPTDTTGLTSSRQDTRGTTAGASLGRAGTAVVDEADDVVATTLIAHEIGHAFTLDHYDSKDPPHVRNDIWAHRCLMHNFTNLVVNPPAETAVRTQVGYGTDTNGDANTGQLIMTKKRKEIRQSDQVDRARKGAETKQFAP